MVRRTAPSTSPPLKGRPPKPLSRRFAVNRKVLSILEVELELVVELKLELESFTDSSGGTRRRRAQTSRGSCQTRFLDF